MSERDARMDRAIDGAVREMLDVEPRADLRARVIERLPAPGSRLPASGFRLLPFGFRLPASSFRLSASRFALVLGAAAVVVLAVFVMRRGDETVTPPSPAVAQRGDMRLPVMEPPVTPPAPVAMSRASAPSPISESPRTAAADVEPPAQSLASGMVVATNVDDDSATTSVAPLQTIAPIAVAPIAQGRIAPAEVGVRPLKSIPEVQIAPLTPPDRR